MGTTPRLTATDLENLTYLAGFASGRCWILPGEEASWKRLVSAGYVTLEAKATKRRPALFRTCACLTEAGRAAAKEGT